MHFTVYCLDHTSVVDKRSALYEQHKAYLATSPLKTLISGPLLAADQTTMIGSFFLYEAGQIDAVKQFTQGDPFSQAGVWARVEIRPFLKRIDNR